MSAFLSKVLSNIWVRFGKYSGRNVEEKTIVKLILTIVRKIGYSKLSFFLIEKVFGLKILKPTNKQKTSNKDHN